VGKMLKTLGFSRKAKYVSNEKIETEKKRVLKRALETDLKLLSKLVKRFPVNAAEQPCQSVILFQGSHVETRFPGSPS